MEAVRISPSLDDSQGGCVYMNPNRAKIVYNPYVLSSTTRGKSSPSLGSKALLDDGRVFDRSIKFDASGGGLLLSEQRV